MTKEEFYEILDDGKKQNTTNNIEPSKEKTPQKRRIFIPKTHTKKMSTKKAKMIYNIIISVAASIFVGAIALVILGVFRRPPESPTIPNNQVIKTPPEEPVGPNGEKPGELGPNGELPPESPNYTLE